jgi:hypothetical protein
MATIFEAEHTATTPSATAVPAPEPSSITAAGPAGPRARAQTKRSSRQGCGGERTRVLARAPLLCFSGTGARPVHIILGVCAWPVKNLASPDDAVSRRFLRIVLDATH